MPKSLLLTVSEQRSSFFSIRFMNHFFPNKKDFRITLFFDESKPHYGHADQRKSKTPDLQAVVSDARNYLVEAGFDKNMIDTKTHLQQLSKAMDIIQEGERGSYDAIVLGKRSISRLEEFLEGSITKELLEKDIDFPLWFCREPVEHSRGILLCMDGSEASFRMAEHVGSIMEQQPGQYITLFRVLEDSRSAAKDEYLNRGREILLRRGITEDRIDAQTGVSKNPAKGIMEKAGKNRYAVVAMGRTGIGRGAIKKIFLGSTSNHLFRELKESTLWVCK